MARFALRLDVRMALLLIAVLMPGVALAGVGEHAGNADQQEQREYADAQADAAPTKPVLPPGSGTVAILAGRAPENQENAARQDYQRREEQAEQSKRRRQHRDVQKRDEFVQIATLVVSSCSVLITALLSAFAWRQIKVNEVAANAARDSAKVATEQVQLLLRQEAPILHFRLTESQPHVLGGTTRPALRPSTSLNYVFDNHGRTPAFVWFHRVEISFGQAPGFQDNDTRLFFASRVIPAGGTSTDLFTDAVELPRGQLLQVMSGEKPLWLGGHIVYRDVYGRVQQMTFRGTFLHDIKQWVVDEQSTGDSPTHTEWWHHRQHV